MACIADGWDAGASFLVIAPLPGSSCPYIYRKLGPLADPIGGQAFFQASLYHTGAQPCSYNIHHIPPHHSHPPRPLPLYHSTNLLFPHSFVKSYTSLNDHVDLIKLRRSLHLSALIRSPDHNRPCTTAASFGIIQIFIQHLPLLSGG
jgi:hypothetical protein